MVILQTLMILIFQVKAKLLGSTKAYGAIGILKMKHFVCY